MSLANGIALSPDEKTLYVTNDAVVMAFDVQAGGSLARQREFGKLRGGQGGDGSAVDAQGRVYVATGASADVFAPNGEDISENCLTFSREPQWRPAEKAGWLHSRSARGCRAWRRG